MLKLGGKVGVRARAQGGNNILCVCGTNVDLYIQLLCRGSGLRGASGFDPHNYGVKIGRKFPPLRLKFPPPTFGFKPPLSWAHC